MNPVDFNTPDFSHDSVRRITSFFTSRRNIEKYKCIGTDTESYMLVPVHTFFYNLTFTHWEK